MEYISWSNAMVSLLVFLIAADLTVVQSRWQTEWMPNFVSREPAAQSPSAQVFEGLTSEDDGFKLLLVEDDKAFVGAKNRVYYMSLQDTRNISTLVWEEDEVSRQTCAMKGKDECKNYIRLVVRKSKRQLYVCGTNAFQPKCRYYTMQKNGKFAMGRQEEESGIGVCPFDPNHNSTALYTDGKIFSGTVADADSRNPLILRKSDKLIRTQLRDSMFLNEPNFVSSYDKDDKVLFFFRETAVENINCGKAVFSRVGRVCKEDEGDAIRPRQNTFTSFFKARLNCSIPGEFPFYFDEIQATSLFGQGNYKPTKDSGDRSDMIYGVFNTPDNSIQGSAVCAFRYSDIADVFRGRFKGQDSIRHNWLPVRWDLTPTPHPEQCETRSQDLSYDSLMFIKTHPLMDEAVPALGHMPMLVHTSFKSKFTAIAIDWQVRAADGHYYDVIFVGTDDGRIIKSINKGKGAQIESVVIEDIQVLDEDEPVVNLKVLSNRADDTRQKLVVISKRRIVSVPLHRCAKALSCSKCVALQDPYCAYNKDMKECISAELGIQNIADGKHESCGPDDVVVKEEPAVTSSPVQTPTCACPATKDQEPPKDKLQGKDESGVKENPPTKVTNDGDKTDPEGNTGASSQSPKTGGTQVEILVIAVVVSIILSLVSGFIIGFKFQSCRNSRDRDSVFYDSKCSTLQRGRNRLSSGDNPYFHTDHTSLTPKQMNYVVNVKNSKTNSGTETKPVTKSNKVYL